MDTFWQDLKYGARGLLKNPGFSLTAALTLALGIGANTAIFSVVNALLFRPLPVKDADQLVVLTTQHGNGFPHGLSYPDYRDYRRLSDIFSDLIAYSPTVAHLSASGKPERIFVERVTGNYFSMLGVEAAAGRLFSPGEGERLGADPIIVLSFRYWQQRFGGDPSVIGETVRLNKHLFTIIGVTPERFPGTEAIIAMHGYVPLMATDLLEPNSSPMLEDRNRIGVRVIGRLQPGVSLERARAAVGAQARSLEQDSPDSNQGLTASVYPEPMARLEPGAAVFLPPIASIFMALVNLVLLIACANVANLMLARGAGRRKEIAIRAALGAGRFRLFRQLLTESVLLAALGGVAGLLLALWITRALASIRLPSDIPIVFDFSLNHQVFLFTLLIVVLTGVISGLAPAFQAAKADLNESLKEGGRSAASGSSRHRLRNLLVVSQVAVSLLLLICAGLFTQSLRKAGEVELGFRTNNQLMLSLDPGLQGLDQERGRIFYRQLLARIRALTGVRSASAAAYVPFGLTNDDARVFAKGQPVSKQEEYLSVMYNVVDTDYFSTLETPIVHGRAFTQDDERSGRDVVIVNQRLAEMLWPGQNPLGKQLSLESENGPFLHVVGVARNSKYNLIGEGLRGYLYLPLSQDYQSARTLHIYTEGEPTALLPAVRQEVRALDPDLPIYDVTTMEIHIRDGKAFVPLRVGAALVGGFGLIGILLAAIGLYGVIAYSVSQRTQEIGIRMALGARPGNVLKLILGRGMMLAGAGVAIGLAAAFALTRFLSSVLVEVGATDPATFAIIPLLLVGITLMACSIPARRATRVDPVVALKYE